MALFLMIIRKMVQSKWLVASLLLGILISVAMVSSMPIYTEAVLSRMLTKDLEQLQLDSNRYPGAYYAHITFPPNTEDQIPEKYEQLDGFMRHDAIEGFQLPAQELVGEMASKSLSMYLEDDPDKTKSNKNMKKATLRSFTELDRHIKLKDGRMPEEESVDGVYETLLTERALSYFNTVLDTVFLLQDDKLPEPIKVRPVGIMEKLQNDDPYFRTGDLGDLNRSMVVPSSVAEDLMLKKKAVPLSNVSWYFVMDYRKMELRSVEAYMDTNDRIKNVLDRAVSTYNVTIAPTALKTISVYLERTEQLRTLMWALDIPILIMLAFYMFMVSHLIVGRQKNEIAILRSRGAARWQVVTAYVVEGMLLCGISLALGPILGAGLTQVLGSSNGFLAFVQRVKLPVRITSESYLFGSLAAAACLIIILIPVVLAARVSIVNHKQQQARLTRTPLWHKLFLDVITLAVAIYGLYSFRKRMDNLKSLGLGATDLSIDPLQFVIPALFILGGGLLLLRLYPWILKLIYFGGKRWWSPSFYATLIQVGRSSSQYQFLMIFLIMTIATGVFSASAARTINANTSDRIQYANGADMVLTAEWGNDAPPPDSGSGPPAEPIQPIPSVIHYMEPAFEPFQKLPGVEVAARVFTKSNAVFSAGNQSGVAELIGVDTDQFGEAVWFRDSLLDYPLNSYLNLIASDSSAVLISRSLARQKELKSGDTISIGWKGVQEQPFKIFGIIDYFPTFNPNPPQGTVDTSDKEADNAPMLIVGNLPHIQVKLALEPYEVWLKLKDGASSGEVYAGIEAANMKLTHIVNTKEELVRAKNDPFLLALNGLLTLGFVLSILVSFFGFLLYWILSLRGRRLQNGILRAIGLSLKHLIAMLTVEQLLTSGAAVMFGMIIGNVASLLYVPNFQIAFNPSSLVPPFMVRFEAQDAIRIYIISGFMLVAGLGILGFMLSRLRIHQALKLGED
ncbi:FtsX-like permease family protein [Paenibacillus sp. HB172176]|uniref:ABC transporter permease n=1 Tax=Paenibacillus sp. HB172176 TaxID=2493690 RepID=UPI00143C266E|nr:FtsX-like permease family protein [Paenibacillus sp. HB172176]